jgi:UDP-N-acetylmuramoyl-tripeptide--D-alanyl-D-alanine ligase
MDNTIFLIDLVLTLVIAGLGIRSTYRLARYFQLEGYNSQRYLRWFARAPLRQIFRLSEGAVKQPFTRTQRATRLLITAFVLASLPAGIFFLIAQIPPQGVVRSIGFAVVTLLLTLVIAPFTLPVANALMFPVEEATRRYYLRLAKNNLKRSGATVIALTGSYGKTSTKHYMNHILGAKYRVLMTPKSYNTLLGVSRVINEILAGNEKYDYFIVEAGAYIPGEIARICQLVEQKIGMVITVGPMHLERFGSIENIVKAKYEIIETLPPDGMGIFNGDDPRVRGMAQRNYPNNRIVITKEEVPGARLQASNVQMKADGLHFDVTDHETGETMTFYTPLFGEHNVTNILMAMAVARHLGLTFGEIAPRVATLQPAEHRLVRRVLPDGTIIIDDAYSANPVGTQTALKVLDLQREAFPNGRRIVLSSGMFELGELHESENRLLGERIAAVATDAILIGAKQVAPVVEGLQAANFPPDRMHVVDTLDEAVAIYQGTLKAGDAVLILTDLPDTYA